MSDRRPWINLNLGDDFGFLLGVALLVFACTGGRGCAGCTCSEKCADKALETEIK